MAVYFIQDGGTKEIKIGFSLGDPLGRLRNFRTGNPRPLKLLVTIPGGAKEEAALHERFADLRGQGEWFRADARLLGFIEALLVMHPNQPKDDGRAEEPEETICGFSAVQRKFMLRAIEGSIFSRMMRQVPTEGSADHAHLYLRGRDGTGTESVGFYFGILNGDPICGPCTPELIVAEGRSWLESLASTFVEPDAPGVAQDCKAEASSEEIH